MNNKNILFMLSLLSVAAVFIGGTTDAFASQAGAMKGSVDELRALLGGNVIASVLTAGVVGGAIISYMKSSFAPFGTSIGIAIGYAFANKWIDTAYSCCI